MSEQLQYQPSSASFELIKKYEGLYLKAYLCPAGVWTLGYGTVMYPDGSKVKQTDVCKKEQAEFWLRWEVAQKANAVRALTQKYNLNQNQFDALVSFTYNLGVGALEQSTLYRKLKIDPNDKTIYQYSTENNRPVVRSCEFLKWVFGGGKILNGLVTRRAEEADLYGKK